MAVLLVANQRVVVDLRDASFIDSTTLSVLLAARRRAEESSLGFAIVLDDRDYTQVHQILDLTGLGPTFAVCEELEDALDAVRAGRVAAGRAA
ncbi:MAG TPA: STAS domain-containing protein [Gaiellaceae bacterium]